MQISILTIGILAFSFIINSTFVQSANGKAPSTLDASGNPSLQGDMSSGDIQSVGDLFEAASGSSGTDVSSGGVLLNILTGGYGLSGLSGLPTLTSGENAGNILGSNSAKAGISELSKDSRFSKSATNPTGPLWTPKGESALANNLVVGAQWAIAAGAGIMAGKITPTN